jgi:hypothetical protein
MTDGQIWPEFDPGPYAADVVFASIVLQNSARRIFKKYSFVAELSCVSMIQYSRAAWIIVAPKLPNSTASGLFQHNPSIAAIIVQLTL